MKRHFLALFVVGTACGPLFDPGSSIQIAFNLYASDELSQDAGTCAIATMTAATAPQKQSGFLELDPALNPNAQYVLNLLVENEAGAGDPGSDFHPQQATINYIDLEGNLQGPKTDVALVSGDVAAGGVAAISVEAVSANETGAWINDFVTNSFLGTSGGSAESVVLSVQLSGVLGSGGQAVSSTFNFPLQLCFGCNNLALTAVDAGTEILYEPTCASTTTPVAVGHGPCCSPQDYYVTCAACGQPGQSCCGGSEGTCAIGSCNGPAVGEICPLIPMNLTESETCPQED